VTTGAVGSQDCVRFQLEEAWGKASNCLKIKLRGCERDLGIQGGDRVQWVSFAWD